MWHRCWQPESLARMSGHYITGKPLPDDLIEKLVNSKKANGGELPSELQAWLFDSELTYHEVHGVPLVGSDQSGHCFGCGFAEAGV